MNRRSFLKMIPALGAAAVVPGVVTSEEPPPIGVDILMDDMGRVLAAKTENPLTKQFHEFPVSFSDWKPFHHGQH